MLNRHLTYAGHEVTDYDIHHAQPALYPDIGMAYLANKANDVDAAQCHNTYVAERANMSIDAQIISICARVPEPELAKVTVNTLLRNDFDGRRAQPMVDLIQAHEAEHS